MSSKSKEYDSELWWTIKNYEIFQDFSQEAAKAQNTKAYLGAAFGLLGAGIAEATTSDYFKSLARVNIIFDEIALYDTKGDMIYSFENLEHILEDDLVADANCECAYFNVDLQFKYFVKNLMPELEGAILNDMSIEDKRDQDEL